jgi:hypothetical protein
MICSNKREKNRILASSDCGTFAKAGAGWAGPGR